MAKKKPAKPRKPKEDYTQIAFRVFQKAIGEAPQADPIPELSPKAAAGRKGGQKGGPARTAKLSNRKRREIAKRAAAARWAKK